MKNALAISFGILILVSVIAWMAGTLAGVVVPLFDGISAERLGAIGFTIGIIGECCAYGFGWLRKRTIRSGKHEAGRFPGPKRYGHKNDGV